VLQYSKGFHKGTKFNLAIDLQSLKIYSYHIRYPNLTYFSSLKNYLQGTFAYQIPSYVPKSVKGCVTKPERVCEISLKFQVPKTILLTFILSKVPQSSNFFSLVTPSTKTNHSSPLKESYRNKFFQDSN